MRLPSITEITGLFRSRTLIESPTYEERYNEALRELGEATFPSERYEALTEMAAAADRLATLIYVESLNPDSCVRREAVTKWHQVRWLCLAIAATEHGLVLLDPSGHLGIISNLAGEFGDLARAADADDRGKRAQILYAIGGYFTEDGTGQADQYSGLTPFLDDIAASEISAYGLTVTAEPEEIAR